MKIKLTVLLGIFMFGLLPVSLMGQSKFKKWEIDFDKEIEWMKVTDAGIPLIATKKDGLFGIDPVDGSTLWQFDEVKNLPEELMEPVSGSNYIIVYGRGFKTGDAYVIDVTTGDVKFTAKEKLPTGLTGGMMPIYQTESLLLVGGDRFVNVNVETGEVLWDVTGFVSNGDKRISGPALNNMRPDKKMSLMTIRGNQPFVFDSKDTFIAHLAANHLAKYNVKTGERIWTFDFKESGFKGKEVVLASPATGVGQMMVDTDLNQLYFPMGEAMMAVDAKSGKLNWVADKNAIKGMVVSIGRSDKGVTVMYANKGKNYVTMLDAKTGKGLWEDDVKVKDLKQFAFMENGDLYTLAKSGLFKINSEDGSVETITKKGVQLGGKEDPEGLLTHKDNLIVTSSQNVMAFKADGTEVFHTYLKPIKESGFITALKVVGTLAVNAMSAAGAYQRAYNTGRSQEYDLVSYSVERFTNSKDRGWFKYITTKVEDLEEGKDFGVARVDMRSGEVVKQIALGDRDINYEIDEIDHLLYAKQGKKTLICYEF